MNNQSRVLTFFGHPWVGIITTIMTVVSFPLSIYFYFASVRAPELTYFVHPLRTKIVSRDVASPLQVTYAGSEIKGNVVVVQVAFWNAGNEPVYADKVLEPFKITIPKSRILEAQIRKVSRPTAAVVLDEAKKAMGEVSLGWKILEKNDGAVIQIIFEGPADAEPEVTGVIVGQGMVNKQTANNKIKTPEEQKSLSRSGLFVIGLMIFISVCLTIIIYFKILRSSPTLTRPAFPVLVVLNIIMLLMYGYLAYRHLLKVTPFGKDW